MERYLSENLAAKWFCHIGLNDKTPDHSYFGQFRKRLGTKNQTAHKVSADKQARFGGKGKN